MSEFSIKNPKKIKKYFLTGSIPVKMAYFVCQSRFNLS